MINNLLTIICVLFLLIGGNYTQQKSVEHKRDHLITARVLHADCAHNSPVCLECTDGVKFNIRKDIIRRVSVNKKNVFRNKTTYKYFLQTNKFSNYQLLYTISSIPTGNLIIHKFLASVIILT
jgi:hypothetical protein